MPTDATSCCCFCKRSDVELFPNPDIDDDIYCETCLAAFNLDRFYRPDFQPKKRVRVEYEYIKQFDKRTKTYTTDGMGPLSLPKTQAYGETCVAGPETKVAVDDGPTMLELARRPHEKIEPTFLRDKHPHPKDRRIRLDETDNKHDYYVQFTDGVEETDFIQSTSSMIHDVFPNETASPHELVFGKNDAFWKHDLCKDYFTEQKVAELKQFVQDVLEPLHMHNTEKYDQCAFTDSILGGKRWGPNHPKHGKYFSADKTQLLRNLRTMHIDWLKKADNGSTRGSFVHYLIELDMNGQMDLATHPVYSKPNLRHIQQYLKWKREEFEPLYEPYRTEMRLFDLDEEKQCSDYRRVGTCDLIAVPKNHPPPDETDGILFVALFDWKNTIIEEKSFFDMETGTHRMGIYPMDNTHHCNLRIYELQQFDYQRMLLEFYRNFMYNGHMYDRMEFLSRQLICFDDTNPRNEAVIKDLTTNLDRELDIIWAKRKETVAKWQETRAKPQKKRVKLTHEQYNFILMHLICKNELFANVKKFENLKQSQATK